MAKKKNAASRSRKQTTPRPTKSEIPEKFDGLTFYFSERIRHRDYSMVEFPDIARELGGEVSGKLTGNVDYLVVHQVKPSAKNEKQAEKLNKDGASIRTIASETFLEMYLPDTEEVLRLLKAGEEGATQLTARYRNADRGPDSTSKRMQWPQHDLTGAKIRGADLSYRPRFNDALNLDGADLRGCTLVAAHPIVSANLKGAKITHVRDLSDCNCKDADFSFADFYGKEISGCDFSGANLSHMWLPGLNSEVPSLRSTGLTLTHPEPKDCQPSPPARLKQVPR